MSYNYVKIPMPQRSLFNKSYTKHMDIQFGKITPVMERFVMPGDTWKIGANCFIRYNPLVAPPLNRARARVRYFFVPLRLVEPQFEDIVTGSHNGKLITTDLPKCKDFIDNGVQTHKSVEKHSFWDYMGVPVGDYSNFAGQEFLPSRYWALAYYKIFQDFYCDENLDSNDYFDTPEKIDSLADDALQNMCHIRLPKDYFTSALPFQQKGVAPTINITEGSLSFSNTNFVAGDYPISNHTDFYLRNNFNTPLNYPPFISNVSATSGIVTETNKLIQNQLEKGTVSLNGTLDMAKLRDMAAMQRLFERLSITGSRYTEFLQGMFGVSPKDETLQRAKYLGSIKVPIITTEVVQTGADGDNPVGTMRGKGITNGNGSIGVHSFNEYGVIFGLMDVLPEMIYSNGINREFTYKSRFDFPIPMFQHLSEQEIRNGELYVNFNGTDNDETFGFHPIYEELKHSQDLVVGDLRPGNLLDYWTQAINFTERPNLNASFIRSPSYLSNFLRPFAVQIDGVYPMVCDFYNDLRVYRPLIRDAMPKL